MGEQVFQAVRFHGRWCLTDETTYLSRGGSDGRELPVTVVTSAQQERITVMRRAGVTYANIATHIGINLNTVKTWCRRAGITPDVCSAGR